MPEAAGAPRFSLRRESNRGPQFADEVRAGLSAVTKSIPPRYFYDELGSALFGAICHLPEYYLTRAETEILTAHRREIAAQLGAVSRLVELGSGDARKTRLLLDQLAAAGELEYIPIDIDVSLLQRTGRELLAEYPALTVTAAASDFRRPSRALAEILTPGRRTAVLFLGSTIGNLDRAESVAMLRDVRSVLSHGDPMLIGADLRKAKAVLDAAYDDSLRVTAAFNLNLLQRINRELGGHFDLRSFAHQAFYDEERGRVEMHLVSLREQSVRIDALAMEIAFQEGESIHTENSYKYDEGLIGEMAAESGFEPVRHWTDGRGWFGEFLLAAR
ncbi:MAG TPA: L-histidine N(alpha)-methyltransferase [Thermoanaerobaculia bacterium]|nr:L-histidine N(alpha)-methyltransferase [Thermoanaerobaculia bacterium]